MVHDQLVQEKLLEDRFRDDFIMHDRGWYFEAISRVLRDVITRRWNFGVFYARVIVASVAAKARLAVAGVDSGVMKYFTRVIQSEEIFTT